MKHKFLTMDGTCRIYRDVLLALLVSVAPLAAVGDGANSGRPDISAFHIITDRNIFDPTRRDGSHPSRGPTKKAAKLEIFTFCGSALDGAKGAAFFDGSGAPGSWLNVGDTINGYKILEIGITSVKLVGTNGVPVILNRDMHMRREEGGPWEASAQTETATASSGSSSSTSAGTPATSTDASANAPGSGLSAEERLKLRKQQEDN
jgi:hypothetical protein